MIFALIDLLLSVFMFILLARVLLSYFPQVDRSNPLVQLVYQVTEPVLRPIREALPQTGMMDFSPLVLIFGIAIIRMFI